VIRGLEGKLGALSATLGRAGEEQPLNEAAPRRHPGRSLDMSRAWLGRFTATDEKVTRVDTGSYGYGR
jgi:hypothetical protein